MRLRSNLIFILSMMFLSLIGNSHVQAGIVAFSGFNNDLEGWTSNTPAEVGWVSAGGNPGGFAQFVDGSSSESWFNAPSAFLGDLRVLDGTGTLSYDHRLLQIGSQNNGIVPLEVRLAGPGGEARWLGAIPTEGPLWNNIVITFQQSDWNTISGSWDNLLTNVTSFWIRAEHVDNGFRGPTNRETATIDNVTLTANPVPEPAAFVSLVIAGAFVLGARIRKLRNIEVS